MVTKVVAVGDAVIVSMMSAVRMSVFAVGNVDSNSDGGASLDLLRPTPTPTLTPTARRMHTANAASPMRLVLPITIIVVTHGQA